jgi:hypothetical protein
VDELSRIFTTRCCSRGRQSGVTTRSHFTHINNHET